MRDRVASGSIISVLMWLTALIGSNLAQAEQVTVAVAANFAAPMQTIAAHFERDTGHRLSVSYGGTGQLYAQIRNGAPFDVFLAGDTTAPRLLLDEGLAVADTEVTYAIGRLALWSQDPELVDSQGAVLAHGQFRRIALANPALAPYGAAALEVIERLGLMQALGPKRVEGANIAQAFQFVSSGNAELGFVALAQVFANGQLTHGSVWMVPRDDHSPILQDAVLLRAGQNNRAAQALLLYLQSEPVKQLIRDHGYETP